MSILSGQRASYVLSVVTRYSAYMKTWAIPSMTQVRIWCLFSAAAGTRQAEEEQVLSKIFLFIAVFFAIWLVIA